MADDLKTRVRASTGNYPCFAFPMHWNTYANANNGPATTPQRMNPSSTPQCTKQGTNANAHGTTMHQMHTARMSSAFMSPP